MNRTKLLYTFCRTGILGSSTRIAVQLFALLLLTLAMLHPSPASATSYSIPGYRIELLPLPPGGGGPFNQAWGLSDNGKVAGTSGPVQYLYDLNTGQYTIIDNFRPLAINNKGTMAGASLSANRCAIRDKHGFVTEFSIPSLVALGLPCDNGTRAISENGKAVGFAILPDGTWVGFVYDSNTGVAEEFLANPVRTIANGITNAGTIVGTTAVDGARAAFVREKDGTLKTFNASNADAVANLTNARGISENRNVISGFYTSLPDFELAAFIVDSSALSSGPGHTDVEVTKLEIRPCNPDSSAPAGYLSFTDAIAYHVRNDGVILGNCGDVYFNPTTNDLIFDDSYVFIATPE